MSKTEVKTSTIQQISRRVRDTLARFDVHWSNVRVLQGECKAERYDKFMEDGAAGGAA